MKILIYLIQLLSTHPPWKLPASRQGSEPLVAFRRLVEGRRREPSGGERSRAESNSAMSAARYRRRPQSHAVGRRARHGVSADRFPLFPLSLFSLSRILRAFCQPRDSCSTGFDDPRDDPRHSRQERAAMVHSKPNHSRFCFRHLRYANVRHTMVFLFLGMFFLFSLFFFLLFFFLFYIHIRGFRDCWCNLYGWYRLVSFPWSDRVVSEQGSRCYR